MSLDDHDELHVRAFPNLERHRHGHCPACDQSYPMSKKGEIVAWIICTLIAVGALVAFFYAIGPK